MKKVYINICPQIVTEIHSLKCLLIQFTIYNQNNCLSNLSVYLIRDYFLVKVVNIHYCNSSNI